MNIEYCQHCKNRLTEKEFSTNAAVWVNQRPYCMGCLQYVPQTLGSNPPAKGKTSKNLPVLGSRSPASSSRNRSVGYSTPTKGLPARNTPAQGTPRPAPQGNARSTPSGLPRLSPPHGTRRPQRSEPQPMDWKSIAIGLLGGMVLGAGLLFIFKH